MKTVIWLKTARVYGQNNDNSPKIERTVVKLEAGDNFNKFLRIMPLKGFLASEPPKVVKVLELQGGEYKEISAAPYQGLLEKSMSNETERPIDYKVEYEKLSQRLKAIEESLSNEGDEELEKAREEYKELFGKAPNKIMKIETIREKINEKLNS